MKILIVFGTRPEVIKLFPVIEGLRHHNGELEMVICSTGQHREMLAQTMDVLHISPDLDMGIMTSNQGLATVTSKILSSISDVVEKIEPDWVVVQGDTTTAYGAALAAFYAGVKVAHVEAGLRTNDLGRPFPEELNRQMIARIASVQFAPSHRAAKNLYKENISSDSVLVTGNTVVDAIRVMREKGMLATSEDISEKLRRSMSGRGRLVLITAHRRESFGTSLDNICHAVKELVVQYRDTLWVFPVHLNPNVRESVTRVLSDEPNLLLLRPLDYPSLLAVIQDADLVLTDSGGIQEEAPSFGTPVIVMRELSERLEGVLAGFSRIVGTDVVSLVESAREILEDVGLKERLQKLPNPYGDGKAGQRIVQYLLNGDVEPFGG